MIEEEKMTKTFATVLNGVITGIHHGDPAAELWGTPFFAHERVEVPFAALDGITPLEPTAFYGTDWRRRPDAELMGAGLLPVPRGHVVEAGSLRAMTEVERVATGLDEKPGWKIERGELVQMTPAERLEAGQITRAQYDADVASRAETELSRRLAELQTPEALARAEVDSGYAASRKTALSALLRTKEQAGWPEEVEWPE